MVRLIANTPSKKTTDSFECYKHHENCIKCQQFNEKLTESQINYAVNDVIYLPKIFEKLKSMCVREKRFETAHVV